MSTTTASDLYPEVRAFLEGGPLKGVVGGNEIEANGGETFVTSDPGSGKQLAEVFSFQAADIDMAVDVADAAFRKTGWAQMPQNERSALLHRLADEVENKNA